LRGFPCPPKLCSRAAKKPHGLMMLSEEINECFSGEFWKRAARLVRNGFYRVPSIIIELDSLTMHGYCSSDTPATNLYGASNYLF
jgi:hypothetical protein